MGGSRPFARSDSGGLRILHRPELPAAQVVAAIEAHRRNAARGREACEQWGPGSSVSRVLLRRQAGDLDLAVKWNHPRGLRSAVGERLRGSRAARALRGAELLAPLGVCHAVNWAIAERRSPGRIVESFLLSGFLDGALPLPAAMPELLEQPARRRAVARAIGELVGALHAAGLDHRDFKHSNLLVLPDLRVALLDLDSLFPPRRPGWRGRVRALGQLEAYASDLYPELPRSDRARVLGRYLDANPELRPRRRELVDAVRHWVEARLADWDGRDRSDHIYFPLAARPALPPTIVEVPATSHPDVPLGDAPLGEPPPAGASRAQAPGPLRRGGPT